MVEIVRVQRFERLDTLESGEQQEVQGSAASKRHLRDCESEMSIRYTVAGKMRKLPRAARREARVRSQHTNNTNNESRKEGIPVP